MSGTIGTQYLFKEGLLIEIIILSEISQTGKHKYITCMWNLKKKKKKKTRSKRTYLQNKNRLTDIENKLMDTKEERRGMG